jgi:hypothetical protein
VDAGRWLEVVFGSAIVLGVFYDIFKTAVLPRPAVGRFSVVRLLNRRLWAVWRWIGARVPRTSTRDAWLAAFGPSSVFVMFGLWVLTLIVGYALLFNGLQDELHPPSTSFGDSLYFSAGTIVPLAYGDVVPISAPARAITFAESASGVLIAALVITLLFSLYQSFQQREELVVTLDAMAGAPPSGLQILETAAERGMRPELIKMFDDWRRWSAAVLESHLAYPMLLYFRSSHDNEAWINSFGAVMDAAALVVSTVEEQSEGAAHLMLTVGNHLVEDSTWTFRLGRSQEPYVEREEYEAARGRLQNVGFRCRASESAWTEFAGLRSRYAHQLNQVAKTLAIVPAQWIGDRSYLPHDRRTGARRGL